jgi:hypothetical protein
MYRHIHIGFKKFDGKYTYIEVFFQANYWVSKGIAKTLKGNERAKKMLATPPFKDAVRKSTFYIKEDFTLSENICLWVSEHAYIIMIDVGDKVVQRASSKGKIEELKRRLTNICLHLVDTSKLEIFIPNEQ